ncbi:HEPN domain-containing protein [Sphingomonas sp. CGMCC 1.13654]|uniref:HEPN domain-containing protein n=1 Tax=Sphingomonas chungangi TaxID=2683589 RepID=A0A838L4L4_9SPHN|nr:HEPN domain-containing protein [Sphingomonas chungangi]MBA2932588.1 HEPN domain-containing protein [Sphingomonas chungangi]MVW56211.1 HEPN domain-containing protein [Sphingomonas chungangi]
MTGLDRLSAPIAQELRRISAIVFDAYAESLKGRTSDRYRTGRIVMLILHGSHARFDPAGAEPGEAFHLLAIVNHPKLARRMDDWRLVRDRLDRAWQHSEITHPVRLTLESLEGINRALVDGRPHFATIAAEGIFLFEATGARLQTPRLMSAAERSARGLAEYARWYERASDFLLGAAFYQAQGNAPMAALLLHQTCEHLYQSALRSLTLHGPRTHAIDELRELAEALEPRLRIAWPREEAPERHAFGCIRRAYIEVRYGQSYRIATDELTWAMERIVLLHELVAKLCPERLSTSTASATSALLTAPEACHVL